MAKGKKKKKNREETELNAQSQSLALINQIIESGEAIPESQFPQDMYDDDDDGISDSDIEQFLIDKGQPIQEKPKTRVIEVPKKDTIILRDSAIVETNTESSKIPYEDKDSIASEYGTVIPADIEMEPASLYVDDTGGRIRAVLDQQSDDENLDDEEDALEEEANDVEELGVPYTVPRFAINSTTYGKYELVRIADGVRSFTIDLNTLDLDDPDLVNGFTDIDGIVKMRLFEVLPHLYPSAIFTTQWMQNNLSGIREYDYEKYIFYRNENENIIFVYEVDEHALDMLLSIASDCLERHVFVSFLNAMLQIVSNVGVSFRNIRESYGDKLMVGDDANYCRNIFNISIHKDSETEFGNSQSIENVFSIYPENYYNDTLDTVLSTFVDVEEGIDIEDEDDGVETSEEETEISEEESSETVEDGVAVDKEEDDSGDTLFDE